MRTEPPPDWSSEWGAIGTAPEASADALGRMRRAERRAAIVGTVEAGLTIMFVAIAGAAVVLSPQITDAVWAVGSLILLALAIAAIAFTRREAGASVVTDTVTFLAAHERDRLRRLRTLRMAAAIVALEIVAFFGLAAWRFRSDATSLTSHHGLATAAGTIVVLGACLAWIRSRTSRCRAEIDLARRLASELRLPSNLI